MYKLITYFFFAALCLQTRAQDLALNGDDFSKGTVWFNTEWPMNLAMFEQKILVVALWSPECLEARREVLMLQEQCTYAPQIQLVSVLIGDTINPMSRSELNAIIQENQITHPIGIAPDFKGFKDINTDKLPVFLLYQQSLKPTLVSNDGSSLEELTQTIKDLVADKSFINGITGWQVVPAIEPRFYADPLIENPEYISSSEGSYPLFITENSHNRIVMINQDGECTGTIGSNRGFQEGNFMSAQFFNPGGTSFDPIDNLLYIADTDNNRVRIADLTSKIVYTLMGNGKMATGPATFVDGPMQPIGLPTDVLFDDRKVYVLSGQTNQLFEADPVSGKANAILSLPNGYWKNGRCRIYAKNISKAKEGFYIVMSNGTTYHWNKKKLETLHAPKDDYDRVAAVVYRNKAEYILREDANKIDVKKKDERKELSGSGTIGWKSGSTSETSFHNPTDMTEAGGDLIICDRGNHLIRIVDSNTGSSSTLRLQPTQELVYSMDALSGGDPVIYDSLAVVKGDNELYIKFDFGDYKLVKGGRNEVYVNEGEGPQIESNELVEEGLGCKFDTEKLPSGLLQFEMYMTVSPKSNPDLIVQKRVFLNILYHITPSAERKQEIEFSPRLLPY